MAAKKYPHSAGWFIWGDADPEAKAEQLQVYAAAKAAGMTVQQWESAGTGHDWGTVSAALAHVMPWMATQVNLTG